MSLARDSGLGVHDWTELINASALQRFNWCHSCSKVTKIRWMTTVRRVCQAWRHPQLDCQKNESSWMGVWWGMGRRTGTAVGRLHGVLETPRSSAKNLQLMEEMCFFCWTGLMTSFDWDGAASLAYDYLGLCPQSRSMIPFPWASQLVGKPGQRARDSVPGVLELRAGGRTLVLAQGNSSLAASVKFLFLFKK